MNNTVDDIAIEDVARIASDIKKPTKRTAHEYVTKIIQELQGSDANGEVYEALSKLYAFFLPPIPAKPKSDFDWVAKAIAKDDSRYYLNYVYVTDRQIVGTDGHRLHIVPNDEGLEPGFYDTAKVKVQDPDWANFPNFERVIPSCQNRPDDYQPTQLDTESLPIDVEERGKTHFFKLPGGIDKTGPKSGPHINRDYLLQALSLPVNGQPITWIGGDADTIRIDFAGDRYAVVMPMRK